MKKIKGNDTIFSSPMSHRSLKTCFLSLLEKRHYVALLNIFRHIEKPTHFLSTYLRGKGDFPQFVQVQSPLKKLDLNLYNYHDLLTLNEIFCREDYLVKNGQSLRTVVDLGANIGLSVSYFLSRNSDVKVYAYEPVPTNLHRLREQLSQNQLSGRVEIVEKAVSNFTGKTTFGIEPSGRYGGIGFPSESKITVQVDHINSILEQILEKESHIDILKIDTEGEERSILEAIDPQFFSRIDLIYAENLEISAALSKVFQVSQRGTVTIYQKTQ